MGSSDFYSMPSEPQDIGQWFSSYVYESPQLSSLDCFEDFDLSIVPETEESEDKREEDSVKRKDLLLHKCKATAEDHSHSEPPLYNVRLPETEESESRRAYNLDEDHIYCLEDSCVSRVPETQESEDRHTENSEEHNLLIKGDFSLNRCGNISRDGDNCSREVLEHTDSISLVSEPPDLKDWFDSYVYKSPTPDAVCELGLWSKADCSDEEENDAPNPREGKEGLSSKSIRTAGTNELASQRAASGGLADFANFPENEDPQHEYFPKESQNANAIQQVDKLNELTDEQTPFRILQDKRIPEYADCSTEGTKGPFSCSADLSKNLTTEHVSYGINCISNGKSTSLKSSPERKHLSKESRCDPAMGDRKVAKGVVNCTNGDEETDKKKDANEGFISTRKRQCKKTGKENSFKLVGVSKPELQRLGVSNTPKANKEAPPQRQVLHERTNIQHPTTKFEKTGKWRCPQNTKPDMGPPLKQLRLEHWVRRVRKL